MTKTNQTDDNFTELDFTNLDRMIAETLREYDLKCAKKRLDEAPGAAEHVITGPWRRQGEESG